MYIHIRKPQGKEELGVCLCGYNINTRHNRHFSQKIDLANFAFKIWVTQCKINTAPPDVKFPLNNKKTKPQLQLQQQR